MRLLMAAVTVVVLALGSISCSGSDSPTKSTVNVTLSEWEIAAEPGTVKAGDVTFEVRNSGEMAHDFVIVKSDLPPGELPTSDEAVDMSRLNLEGSAGPFAPGTATTGENGYTVNLSPGKYVLLCDIVTREGGDVESHYRNGMYTSFLVEP